MSTTAECQLEIKSRTIAHMNYNDPTHNIAQSLFNR